MLRSLGITIAISVSILLGFAQSASAAVFDDFSGEQQGSWAPVRWWTDYACRGKFIVPKDASGFFDIAVCRAQRKLEILAAKGFIVEVDVLDVKKSAAVCIGPKDFRERGIAVLVHGENNDKSDKLYINGQAFEIQSDYQTGQRIRIEVDTDSFEKNTQADISVYFGGKQVISEQTFTWKSRALWFYLSAVGAQAVFDNLLIKPAQTEIEFVQSSASGPEKQQSVAVDLKLEHAEPGKEYSVDYAVRSGSAIGGGADMMFNPIHAEFTDPVRSGSAIGGGADYKLDGKTLTFQPGQTRNTITLTVTEDDIKEPDESLELVLFNPRGGLAQIGHKSRFQYTILGEWPSVRFEKQNVIAPEQSRQIGVNVTLSHPCEDKVTVDYDVIPGTAVVDKDYSLKPGTLVFEPGQTCRKIMVNLLDDSERENSINETVQIKLSNTKNCVPGAKAEATLEIVDDELGIEWDGCVWLPSTFSKHTIHKGSPMLCVNSKGQLEWVTRYGDLLLVKMPKMSVDETGKAAKFGWLYKGRGNDTGSYVENICERYGSGDLRLAALDSSGTPFTLNKRYNRGHEIFCGYKGYQARLSPHVPPDMRADKWAKRVNPMGDNCGSPVDWGGCWGFPKYFNGHGAPVGRFTPLIFTVERTAENIMEFSVELNNIKHTYRDDITGKTGDTGVSEEPMESLYGDGSYHVRTAKNTQPKKIDTLAIYFANQRPFDLITFASMK